MKILVFDIETAPKLAHVWRVWKENIPPSMLVKDGYILCWAAKWVGEDEVMSDTLFNYGNKLDNEHLVASSLYRLIEEADAVVTYNGDKFDIKVMNTAFVTHGMTPPTSVKSIDLYKTVRKQFNFTSNKLDFVCDKLGLDRKEQHSGFELWKGCMEGDPDCWKKMEQYNVQDVIITEQLYQKLLPWIHNHPNVALYSEDTEVICTNCGSDNLSQPSGTVKLKAGSYKRYKCNDCGNHMRGKVMQNSYEKRQSLLVSV